MCLCSQVSKRLCVLPTYTNYYSLSSLRSDDQLEHSVTQAFSVFGNVYVKIRRDNKGMPFAFCQYEVARVLSNETHPKLTLERTHTTLSVLSPWVVVSWSIIVPAVQSAQKSIVGFPIDLFIAVCCGSDKTISIGSLYLSKVNGDSISEAEAVNVLAKYGQLEKVWYCSPTEKEMYHLPEGVWTKFAYYQDCRDAQAVGCPPRSALLELTLW